jgi:hypothetical protein
LVGRLDVLVWRSNGVALSDAAGVARSQHRS